MIKLIEIRVLTHPRPIPNYYTHQRPESVRYDTIRT